MNTLLLRIVGPMQSWGIQSQFSVRDTGLEPSKSGVIGLVCAALGVDRNDDEFLATLSALRMGVRVDREGRLSKDYHTALKVLKASGGIKENEPSTRYYLADAAFLVGLEGETPGLLEKIQVALQHPVWPIFLGRKAFLPSLPLWLPDGFRLNENLQDALEGYPYIGRGNPPAIARLVLEDFQSEIVRHDQPVSFQHNHRLFSPRHVKTVFIPVQNSEAL